MAVKRRVVWLSDDEWNLIQNVAAIRGLTASAWIREQIAPPPEVIADMSGTIPAMSQKERDRILRRISKSE